MVELRILRERNTTNSRITTLKFRTADLDLFRNLLRRMDADGIQCWREKGSKRAS